MRKSLTFVIMSLIAFSFVATALSATDLEEIQKAIKEKGAKWTASENWVTRLSPEERKMIQGDLGMTPPDQRIATYPQPPLSNMTYPDTFDWRDNDGYNWMSGISNQGTCGNCWAHASCGALEAVTRITLNEPNKFVNLSEMFLTWCSGRGCDLGWDQSSSLNYIKSKGVCDEYCCPITADFCSDTCDNRYMRSIFIQNWWYQPSPTIDVIKDRIMTYGPVTVHFQVYEDFDAYNDGVYTHSWGEERGSHAVSFVGWQDAESCWIAKNSWGPDWGEDGWFRIAMQTSGTQIDDEIWYMTVDTATIHELFVILPNGGETYIAQEQGNINWESPYFTTNVRLDYSTDGGSNWYNITPSTYNDGDYTWYPPNERSSNCYIKVSDAVDEDPYDISDNPFKIIQRGDLDKDGNIGLGDVMLLALYKFKSGAPPDPMLLGDVNCDGLIEVNDIIYLANYLFKSGSEPGCP